MAALMRCYDIDSTNVSKSLCKVGKSKSTKLHRHLESLTQRNEKTIIKMSNMRYDAIVVMTFSSDSQTRQLIEFWPCGVRDKIS